MLIRAHFAISIDGFVAPPDGKPVMFTMPGFVGATSYGHTEFFEQRDAVVIGVAAPVRGPHRRSARRLECVPSPVKGAYVAVRCGGCRRLGMPMVSVECGLPMTAGVSPV